MSPLISQAFGKERKHFVKNHHIISPLLEMILCQPVAYLQNLVFEHFDCGSYEWLSYCVLIPEKCVQYCLAVWDEFVCFLYEYMILGLHHVKQQWIWYLNGISQSPYRCFSFSKRPFSSSTLVFQGVTIINSLYMRISPCYIVSKSWRPSPTSENHHQFGFWDLQSTDRSKHQADMLHKWNFQLHLP